VERAGDASVSGQRPGAHAYDPARRAALDQRKIDLEHLPAAIRGEAPAIVLPKAATMAPLSSAIKQFERDYLVRALAEFEGKKGRAAESLGISRKNLWEKLKMHASARPRTARRSRSTAAQPRRSRGAVTARPQARRDSQQDIALSAFPEAPASCQIARVVPPTVRNVVQTSALAARHPLLLVDDSLASLVAYRAVLEPSIARS